MTPGIDPTSLPSGSGCAECDDVGGWWVHLRRCAECGHIGCCDSSPAQHATAHWKASSHPIITSFEPGEDWFWDYERSTGVEGQPLAPPASHPDDQAAPGPAERVPDDWRERLNT